MRHDTVSNRRPFISFNPFRFRKGTPEYVLAHARWLKSQGKKPVLPFKGVTDPEAAYQAAENALQGDVEPCGIGDDHINGFAKRVVALRRFLGRERLQCTFNGVKMTVTLRATPAIVRTAYDAYLLGYQKGGEEKEQEINRKFRLVARS